MCEQRQCTISRPKVSKMQDVNTMLLMLYWSKVCLSGMDGWMDGWMDGLDTSSALATHMMNILVGKGNGRGNFLSSARCFSVWRE